MNVREPIITSLISLATFVPCKAQKTLRIASETGLTGVINKEASFYNGIDIILPRGKNVTTLYGGGSVQPNKKLRLLGLL